MKKAHKTDHHHCFNTSFKNSIDCLTQKPDEVQYCNALHANTLQVFVNFLTYYYFLLIHAAIF